MSKEIVVTGLGCATQFGYTLDAFWNALYEGRSAVRTTENVELDKIYCHVSAQIPEDEAYFPWEKWQKAMPGGKAGKFTIFGLEAAEQALADAGLISGDSLHVDPSLRVGVVAGSGIGGLNEVYNTSKVILERGADRVSPYFVPAALINLLPGHIAIRHQIKGPNQSQVGACATGAIAIADGARMIREGICDIVLVGAAEASIGRIGLAGFCALHALSKGFNDNPAEASRPFDANRAGFVMGDGAGMLVLESKEHALKRGAKIYCEYLSAGLTNDAYNMTAPCADGAGASAAIRAALEYAGLKPEDVGYVNAHATSTPVGDAAEITAIKAVFGPVWDKISVSSIKGAIGHMLGAAGAVEAIATVLSLHKQAVLPTLNLKEPLAEAKHNDVLVDLVPNKGKKKEFEVAVKTSFGFGGHNAVLAFRRSKNI